MTRSSPWDPSETEDFKRICIKNKFKWSLIAKEFCLFSGKEYNGNQCMNRWGHIDPDARKGPWSEEENQLLRTGVESFGNEEIKWGIIAKNISGRSAKQCRERWKTALEPTIDRSEFKEHEDQLILERRLTMEGWSAIASGLPGRVDNMIKNRWNTIILQALKRLNLKDYVADDIPRIVQYLRCARTPQTSNRKNRALRDVTNDQSAAVENETPLKRYRSSMDSPYQSPLPSKRRSKDETPIPFGDGGFASTDYDLHNFDIPHSSSSTNTILFPQSDETDSPLPSNSPLSYEDFDLSSPNLDSDRLTFVTTS